MLKVNLSFFLIISILVTVFSVNNKVFAKDLTMNQLARSAVESYLGRKNIGFDSIKLVNVPKKNIKGVFVTLLDKDKKSRGCWGKLYPQADIKESLISAAIGTVKKDYRFKPVTSSEFKNLKVQVSLVTNIEPVDSFSEINPFGEGMLVESKGRTGIIMPGEAVDPHYQMVQCKLKAGIQPGERFNLFKLRTNVYKE